MESSTPLISVVIPTFNRGYVIKRTLLSVINQTYKNIEIIVVDDSSTDNTKEIIETIKKEYDVEIKYINLEKKANGAVARNKGIEVANGHYIAFLDSDDFWDKHKIEKQYNNIEKNGIDTTKTVCYTKLIGNKGNSKKTLPKRGILVGETVGEYLFNNNGLMQTSTLLISKELLEKIKFSPTLKKHQDWDLCLKLYHYGAHFVYIDEPLVTWSIEDRKDRVSNENDYKYSLEWINLYKDIITEKVFFAFLGKVVSVYAGRSGKKCYALSLCFSSFKKRSISLRDFIITLVKIIIPLKILNKLVAYKI